MDINDIKEIIRTSIKTKLMEHKRNQLKPACDFSAFRLRLSGALNSSCGSILDSEVIVSSPDNHGPLYEAWRNIELETHDNETWNESVEYYVPNMLFDILGDKLSEVDRRRAANHMKIIPKK